jgi:ParB-like chromosome segregation protein Spo0J
MLDTQIGLFDPAEPRRVALSERIKPAKLAKIVDKISKAFSELEALGTEDKVEAINAVRERLHALSPFKDEPVDFVRWVPSNLVHANDYNPNSVAPPEMELLRLSIMADGYTQPIVTNQEEARAVVVDGFHRNRVGKECEDVVSRVKGYLPIVQIRSEQTDKPDRMASTVRHNRARGKHRVDAMADIVLELKRRNWSNEKIGKQLGMDPDEVLRLAQITGLAEMFKDREFSQAWEANPDALIADAGEIIGEDDDLGSEADGALK